MSKKKINGFTCFLMILISLTLFFFLRLTYEIQKEKQQYTILISLGNLSSDQDFLKKASKINGLQEYLASCGNSSNHKNRRLYKNYRILWN